MITRAIAALVTICACTAVLSSAPVVSLGPVNVWIGLTNSADAGVRFDLRAEVYRNGTHLVGSGELLSVAGGSSGFNNAHQRTIPLTPAAGAELKRGDILFFRLLVRNACVGSAKNSGRMRLWFNDAAANSRFETNAGGPVTYYLRPIVLTTTVGQGPRLKIDTQTGARCGSYRDVSTWIGIAAAPGTPVPPTDTTPPTISAVATPPPNAAGWNNTPVTVTFSCADSGSGVLSCPAPVTVSPEGAGQIQSGTATDKAGNTASASVSLNIDTIPPIIFASPTPPPGLYGWNNTPVSVEFICDDGGSQLDVCPPVRMVTAEGAQQIVTGTATDRAGNQSTASSSVSVDLTPPVLAFVSPAPGPPLFAPTVDVSATVADPLSGVSGGTCGAQPVTVIGGTLACTVTLVAGPNSVGATAIDRAGNVGTGALPLIYHRAPGVTFLSPAPQSYLNISPTTISGTVDDPTAIVTINSVPAPLVDGHFSIALPVAEGPNVITATAVAATGAVGTTSVEATLDTTAPRVTVTSPADNFVTHESSVTIAGNVNDTVVGTVNALQAQVTVNGLPAEVANRTFLATDVPLTEGPNVIQVVGTDRVGNAFTTQVTVVRRALAEPRIRVVSGNNQSGSIASALLQPMVVALTDAADAPVANKPVVFKVMQNDGLVASAAAPAPTVIATTDSQGIARAYWTLGTRAGAGGNVVEAYAVGFAGTAVFTATATEGPAGMIVVDAGNGQAGAIGQPLSKSFIAVVVDAGNNRLGGVPVTFTVTGGDGSFDGVSALTVMSDPDGRAAATLTLGTSEDVRNVAEATFAGNTGTPASFTAVGRVPGPPAQTSVTGVILDNSNVPIAGVVVRAVLTNELRSSATVVQTAIAAQTDAQGQFTIPGAPVGLVKVLVDGSTASRPGVYPSLEYDIVTVSGQVNTVGAPIYLLPLNTASEVCVTETTGGGTLTLPESPGFSLTFGPGQVTFPGGSKTGCISVTAVNSDKVPMEPAFGQQPRFIVTIQPPDARFSPPAALTLPNVDALRPRSVTEMYSFDHDIGSFVAIGTGTVSDDGAVIRSDPGVGVLKAGWHGGGPPNPNGNAATCPVCQMCVGNACVPNPATEGQPCSTADIAEGVCRSGRCGPRGTVLITQPADTATRTIDATPTIAEMVARARVTGLNPDPTSATAFDWIARVEFNATACSHGTAVHSYSFDISHGGLVGGLFTLPASSANLRGGKLTLIAAAIVSGYAVSDDTAALKILGTNPQRSEVQAALPHDTLRKIACQESGQRQFLAAANGGVGECPLFSQDDEGGAGIMQLTRPLPTADQVWNWRLNVSRGVALFSDKVRVASGFARQVRQANDYQALVDAVHADRLARGLPAIEITLPDYTTGDFNNNLQQLELDALRGNNGYGPRTGQFGFSWREFRVLLDANGNLVIDANGRASWQRVPVAERPSGDGNGDPNYVNHILGQNPLCGG